MAIEERVQVGPWVCATTASTGTVIEIIYCLRIVKEESFGGMTSNNEVC